MDKFCVDLDKVLDDLELDEGAGDVKKSGNYSVFQTNAAVSNKSMTYATTEPLLDLDDADFAPSNVFNSVTRLDEIKQASKPGSLPVIPNFGNHDMPFESETHLDKHLGVDILATGTQTSNKLHDTVITVTDSQPNKQLDTHLEKSNELSGNHQQYNHNSYSTILGMDRQVETHSEITSTGSIPVTDVNQLVINSQMASPVLLTTKDEPTDGQSPFSVEHQTHKDDSMLKLQDMNMQTASATTGIQPIAHASMTSQSSVTEHIQSLEFISSTQFSSVQNEEQLPKPVGFSAVVDMQLSNHVNSPQRQEPIGQDSYKTHMLLHSDTTDITDHETKQFSQKDAIGFGQLDNAVVSESVMEDYLKPVQDEDDIICIQLGQNNLEEDTIASLDQFSVSESSGVHITDINDSSTVVNSEPSQSSKHNSIHNNINIDEDNSESFPPGLGIGARPKEPVPMKRPNSLLGLSTVALDPSPTKQPEINPGENSNDIINRQLVEASKISMRKKQLNLEIKSQIQDRGIDVDDLIDNRFCGNGHDNKHINETVVAQSDLKAVEVTGAVNLPVNTEVLSETNRENSLIAEGTGTLSSNNENKQNVPWDQEASLLDTYNTGENLQQQVHTVDNQIILPSDRQNVSLLDLQQIPGSLEIPGNVTVPNQVGTETSLGKTAPQWIPDSETSVCMDCEVRFTFTKRRHHCRACGKVFCNNCCKMKLKLELLDNKEGRVCTRCYHTISAGSQKRESKSVMFSDGIRPGGDLCEEEALSSYSLPNRPPSRSQRKVERQPPDGAGEPDGSEEVSRLKSRRIKIPHNKDSCFITDIGLPPVWSEINGDVSVEETPGTEKLMQQLKDVDAPPVVFAVNKNLFVLVKILNLDCCVNRICWCFTTKGLCIVGQEEVVIVLEYAADETDVPRDIFVHVNRLYQEAAKGDTVSHMDHSIVPQPFLGSRDHCGFLYIRATFQCLHKLVLPQAPYIFGILLQKWETPWAKVFPLRLMLRLGAEYRYYPCPLISIRFRRPAYFEIGHTIMNLLADFRNYQYTLPCISGVTIHMQEKKTYINLPRNRYNEVMKVVNSSNDHVVALGSTFSTKADSHLVCIQNEEGNYQTQAINIQNKPRQVTGASFVVFNGALKDSSGLTAKSSIVEDGLMVQINSNSMSELKQALHDMKDYTIGCGSIGEEQSDEMVMIQWTDDDKAVNIGVRSPIDGMAMDGIESLRIHCGTDFIGENHTIRWTEVFFLQTQGSGQHDPIDLSRLAEMLAQACCIALTPHLDKLKQAGLIKIGLRVNIDPECVGYEIGSCGEKLAAWYMNDMDNEMIPVIHNATSQSQEGPAVLELLFYVIR